MKIVIDGRFWGIHNTGLGRYVMNLVIHLAKIDQQNHYHILIRQELANQFPIQQPNIHPVIAESRHYSLKEQLLLPQILFQLKPDIFHAPHFNIPLIWSGKLVVTIHDLIKQTAPSQAASTLPTPFYWLKWAVHRQVISRAIHASSAIICPSEYTKQQIIQHYPGVNSTKIAITYEAPDATYFHPPKKRFELPTDKPYIVYTGNLYPHKNIDRLLIAIRQYNRQHSPLSLMIVCARDVFQTRLNQLVQQTGLSETVFFLGRLTDQQLASVYQQAQAFITPSMIEGFGLPGLEAMASGTPVLSAQATSLPEIYQKHAVYFDPTQPEQMVNQIHQVINWSDKYRHQVITAARKYAQTFTWDHLAHQTLAVYQQVHR